MKPSRIKDLLGEMRLVLMNQTNRMPSDFHISARGVPYVHVMIAGERFQFCYFAKTRKFRVFYPDQTKFDIYSRNAVIDFFRALNEHALVYKIPAVGSYEFFKLFLGWEFLFNYEGVRQAQLLGIETLITIHSDPVKFVLIADGTHIRMPVKPSEFVGIVSRSYERRYDFNTKSKFEVRIKSMETGRFDTTTGEWNKE